MQTDGDEVWRVTTAVQQPDPGERKSQDRALGQEVISLKWKKVK